jgi:hypothetical protein
MIGTVLIVAAMVVASVVAIPVEPKPDVTGRQQSPAPPLDAQQFQQLLGQAFGPSVGVLMPQLLAGLLNPNPSAAVGQMGQQSPPVVNNNGQSDVMGIYHPPSVPVSYSTPSPYTMPTYSTPKPYNSYGASGYYSTPVTMPPPPTTSVSSYQSSTGYSTTTPASTTTYGSSMAPYYTSTSGYNMNSQVPYSSYQQSSNYNMVPVVPPIYAVKPPTQRPPCKHNTY